MVVPNLCNADCHDQHSAHLVRRGLANRFECYANYAHSDKDHAPGDYYARIVATHVRDWTKLHWGISRPKRDLKGQLRRSRGHRNDKAVTYLGLGIGVGTAVLDGEAEAPESCGNVNNSNLPLATAWR